MTYEEKISDAFIRAIMEAGLQTQPDGSQAVVIDSGAVTSVCLSTIALVIHTSQEAATPSKTRALCDDLARQLQRKIVRTQNDKSLAAVNITTATVGTAH